MKVMGKEADFYRMLRIALITFLFLCLIILKIWYRTGDVRYFKAFLYPASSLVSLTMGMDFFFESSEGYVSRQHDIVINKTCSGINFFITALSFALVFFYILKPPRTSSGPYQLWNLLLLSVSSYILTILANSSRIVFSIVLLNLKNSTSITFLHDFYGWIHFALGIAVFLIYFALYYLLLEKLWPFIRTEQRDKLIKIQPQERKAV